MDFVPLLAATALVYALVNLLKYVRAKDWQAVATQGASWAGGVIVTFLLAATDFAEGIEIGGKVLGDLNAASLLLIGLSIAASSNVVTDARKAVDRTDSASTPGLLTGVKTPRV